MARKKQQLQETVEDKDINKLEKALSIFEEMDKDYCSFKPETTQIDVIDTGSVALNNTIGINGFPCGRVVHVYAPYGSGKSFLCQILVKNALSRDTDSCAIWIDCESSFVYDWAEKLSVFDKNKKDNRLKIIKTNDGKEIFERLVGKYTKGVHGTTKTKKGILDYIIDGTIKCKIIVIDSVADMLSEREKDAPVGGHTVSALAGFLTAELKRIGPLLERAGCSLVLINQARENIGEDEIRKNGKWHYPGGQALAHRASLNLFIERVFNADSVILEDPNDKNTIIGQKVKITVKKSRFSPAPRSCYTTFLFKEGAGYNQIGIVNVEQEIIELGIKSKVIKQGGAWLEIPFIENKICGIDKAAELLRNDKELCEKLKALISGVKYESEVEKEEDNDINDLFANSETAETEE